MITKLLSSRSLLTQFLVFNLLAFIILGFFTFLYLKAIQPELVSKQSDKHLRIIKNIEANLNIKKINIDKESSDIEDRTIDSHVKRIRKKFKKIDKNFSAIETRYGSGYRWNVD